MNISLKGKTAMVCGSSQGIGFAIAKGMADLGARLILVARSQEGLESALGKLEGDGHEFIVADFNDTKQVAAKISDYLKNNSVDILVNNSGGPPGGPIIDAQPEEFLEAYHRHLLGNHVIAQSVVPGMKKAGGGRIINVISTSVYEPINGLGVSNTTRAAVSGWAKTLANELGPDNITVNNILPGATNTVRLSDIFKAKASRFNTTEDEIANQFKSAIPLGRFAEAEEVANMAIFLAGPSAAYVSGQSISIDGGRQKSI